MNFHGKDIKIFTGSSNIDVAKGIAGCLGVPLGKSDCTQFSDGEISVSLHESVRGSDCFIVQSSCAPVNDNLMEMLIMIDAMKRASAARITAVMPYFGYARQDRKAKARDPIQQSFVLISSQVQVLTVCLQWIFTLIRFRASSIFLLTTSTVQIFLQTI